MIEFYMVRKEDMLDMEPGRCDAFLTCFERDIEGKDYPVFKRANVCQAMIYYNAATASADAAKATAWVEKQGIECLVHVVCMRTDY